MANTPDTPSNEPTEEEVKAEIDAQIEQQKEEAEAALAKQLEADRKADEERMARELDPETPTDHLPVQPPVQEVESAPITDEPSPDPATPDPEEKIEERNEHNDDPKKRYDKDVVEETAAVLRVGSSKPLDVEQVDLDQHPSPELERVAAVTAEGEVEEA